ncbi:MAG: HAMP domain-containing histidine kinase [Planctomycetes bacterium]|nr:HAMP domain-containing histidine kinase [Planctomycetota bacterium]
MRLRTRLALTLALTAVPLSLGLVALHQGVEAAATERSLAEFARNRMEGGGRELCEADPAQFQEPPQWMREGRGRNGESAGPARAPRPEDPPESARPPPRPEDGSPDSGRLSRVELARLRRGQFGFSRSDVRFELFAYKPDFQSDNPRAPAFPTELESGLSGNEPFAGRSFDDGVQHGTLVGVRMPWNEGPAALVLLKRIESGPPEQVWTLYGGALALSLSILAVALLTMGPIVRRVRSLTGSVRRSAESGYEAPVADTGSDEIAELAQAFNSAGSTVREKLSTIERREKTLRAFVENTTHDVMLPLTVLQGHLSSFDKRLEKNEPIARDRVRESLEEAYYLGALVHNLAAAAKLEAGEPGFVRHPFSLNQLVARVMGRHEPIARAKEIELVHAVPEAELFTSGDVTLFEQALSNVVHNALRYNKAGGHAAVLLEEQGEEFVLRVVDDGPGASDEELARLTERSFRSEEARSRHPNGLGLGLSIAKDVSDRHGFAFTLKKSEHGGLEVEFRGKKLVRT